MAQAAAAAAEPRGRLTEAFHGTLKQLSTLHHDAVQAFQGTLSQLSILHEKEVQALQLQVFQLRRHLDRAGQASFDQEVQGSRSNFTVHESPKVLQSEEPGAEVTFVPTSNTLSMKADCNVCSRSSKADCPFCSEHKPPRVPHFPSCWWLKGDHGGGPGSREVPQGDVPPADEPMEVSERATWSRAQQCVTGPSATWVPSGGGRPSGNSLCSGHRQQQIRLSKCVDKVETLKKEMEQCGVPAVRRMRRFRRRFASQVRTRVSGSMGRWSMLVDMVEHPGFDLLCAMVILVNSAVIGVDVVWNIQHGEDNPTCTAVGTACSVFFLCELLVRIMCHGCNKMFCQEGWGWNVFDLILVMISAFDIVVLQVDEGINTVGSALKTVKMLRIVRVFRVFRFFRELSLLALMIIDSMKSLMWAIVLVTIMTYVCAIWFTQAANVVFDTSGTKDPDTIQLYFGNLGTTIVTLIQATLGGVSWGVCSDALASIHWSLEVLFFFYIAFSILAVLNIITGVFVDNAVETAQTQREFLVQKEMELKERYVCEMKNLFAEMDKDGNGTVTAQEVNDFLQDNRIMSYFQALGLDPHDTERLFRLIDEDESGGISIDEFLSGCLRLKGQARSIDIHALLFDLKKLVNKFERMETMVKKSFGPMSSLSGLSTTTLLKVQSARSVMKGA